MAGGSLASSGGGFGGKKRGGKGVSNFGKEKLRVYADGTLDQVKKDIERLEKKSGRMALELKLREAEALGGTVAGTMASGEQLGSATRSREEVMEGMEALNGIKVAALLSAVWNRDVGMVKALIEGGIDVNAPNKDGMTACRLACQEGLTEVLKELSKAEGFDVDETWAEDGATPLFLVCQNGFCEAAKVLLRAGADSNKGICPGNDLRGVTPMIMACQNGHVEVKP